jgi:hypothetical protein
MILVKFKECEIYEANTAGWADCRYGPLMEGEIFKDGGAKLTSKTDPRSFRSEGVMIRRTG